tara:strand:- start:243 stop:668 length:426 start_codon:yes stop_codon:yes gene_type:complete
MRNNYINGGLLKEFWKTKKFQKKEKYNSKKEVEEKVKEIALTYHDEITPLESDGSKNYRPEIEFLDYCHSGTHGWDLAFSSMALLNFSDSIIETFSIEEEIVEKCLDDLTLSAEARFNNLIDLLYNEYEKVYCNSNSNNPR